MSSVDVTVTKIVLINHLVATVGLLGPEPGPQRRLEASRTAARRVIRGPIDESELRAVIYDALFPRSSSHSGLQVRRSSDVP